MFIFIFEHNIYIFSAISFPIVISPKEFRIKEEEHILLYSNQTDTVNIEVEDFSTKKNILFHSQFNLIQGKMLYSFIYLF